MILLHDWAGWALLAASYVALLGSRDMRRNPLLLAAAFLALTAHHATAMINAYFTTIKGAADALAFHRWATRYVTGVLPWSFTIDKMYSQFLGFNYKVFGISLFFGQQLSVFGFVISAILFVKVASCLGIRKRLPTLMLMFGLLPSSVIYRSVTQRESSQVLFTMLAVHAILRLRRRRSVGRALVVVASCLGLAMTHKGLAVFGAFLMLAALFWGFGMRRKLISWQSLAGVFVASIVAFVWLELTSGTGGASEAVATGRIFEYAAWYRSSLMQTWDTRANYGIMLDTSSLTAMAWTLFLAFVYYMCAPFPWQVGNVLDVYATFETLLRFTLIYHTWKTWRHQRGEDRSRTAFLFLMYFAMECLWALGTVNWGTAMRHHMPGYVLLVLLGGPRFVAMLYRFIRAPFEPVGPRTRPAPKSTEPLRA